MKVLMVTPLYPPAVGGAATYYGEIAPRVAQRDPVAGVTVLTEYVPGGPLRWQSGQVRVLRWLPTRLSVGQHCWPIHAATYLLTQFLFALCLPVIVRWCQIDLVHFHTRYRGRLFYSALQRCGVPVVADLHDKMSDPKSLLGVADRLLCCGRGVQEYAITEGFPPTRTVLVPLLFRPPQVPTMEQVSQVLERHGVRKGRYLLFVGDITWSKGVFDLLEAYQRWRAQHPSVLLVLAGPNREGKRFLKQARQTEGAMYLGPVPHRQAIALMRGAEIVVLPSRSEGLPRVILEAISLGRKVVCPPGVPEFERHLPEYVLPEVSAEAVLRLLSAVWSRRDSPRYPFVEHEVDRVVDKLLSVYTGVARGTA